MARSTRIGLICVAALLIIAGAYTAYWFIVAQRIEDGVLAWAQSSRANKVDVSWQKMRLSGFPVTFHVELETARMLDASLTPSPELRVPSLSGSARPWDFADWRLTAPGGFTADLASTGTRVPAQLTARTAEGAVSIDADGGCNLWLRLRDASLQTASRVLAGSTDAWIEVPPKPLPGHTEPKMTLAVAARQVQLPAPMGPLGDTLDELDFGATVKGAIPNGRLTDALAVWRDAGGTIELDKLRLRWGGLAATASGTIALDEELQPVGAFSGGVEGYDEILTALVEGGRMRASDAGLARIALRMLAKPGPNGEPEIKTSFTIQNGQMFLGPAKLGKAPRLAWE